MKQLEIEVDVDPSRRPIEAVEHGDLDVALTTVPPTDPQFTLTPLFDDDAPVEINTPLRFTFSHGAGGQCAESHSGNGGAGGQTGLTPPD